MTTGVIYVAIGDEFVDEACRSALSLKSNMPNVHVTLFSGHEVESCHFDTWLPLETREVSDHRSNLSAKILGMSRSPYDYTLFLDADTYVCDDISELFELLDHFDIAASHASIREAYSLCTRVPACFPEFNTGVVLFRKSSQMSRFFRDWIRLHNQNLTSEPRAHDQPAFREALYKSDLRVATLPPEYNCRFIGLGYLHGPTKILHGRHSNLKRMARTINAETAPRVHVMNNGVIELVSWPIKPSKPDHRVLRITRSLWKTKYLTYSVAMARKLLRVLRG